MIVDDVELAASVEWNELSETLKASYGDFQAFHLPFRLGVNFQLELDVHEKRKALDALADNPDVMLATADSLLRAIKGDQCNP